jgi:dihydroorotate dehydrogenase (NAD+) catalytic subunit
MTTFCGIELAHPVVNGSGTFDAIAARRAFGDALLERFPFSAFVSKTITLQPRAGNPPPRLWEAPAGLVNSIGLPNKGLEGYLRDDLPELARLPVPLITNVMGATAEEVCALVEAVDARPEIAAIELNVSCPNVTTGLDLGADPDSLAGLLRAVRPRTAKPLVVKLTPNTADVAAVAQAAEAEGADAVSLINTLRARPAHPAGDGRPWLGGITGGLSGPAVRAVALAQVAAVAARVAIPIVGMGGVRSGSDARDLMAVGATLVAVGTESFRDPRAGARVAEELKSLQMKKKRSTTLDGPEAQVEVERNSAAEPCEPQPRL